MESTIDILNESGLKLYTITFSTSSYMLWEVMGEHSITLNFSLPQITNNINEGYIEIPIGSYIIYKSRRYTLYNPSDFIKNGNRKYDYTLKLYSYQELLNDRIFINEPDGMQVFSRMGRPQDFLQAIVRNMNHFDVGNWNASEWTIGSYLSSDVQQLIQFNGVSCSEALRLVAEAFKTEWEINNKVISLKKVEYNKNAPLVLSYGKGNGFLPGLGRANYDQNRPIHKLYVKGSERNIEFSYYGSKELLLPKNATIRYDGSKFSNETGYNASLAREYRSSSDGMSLTRVGTQNSRREAYINLTEAYPKRIGTISRVTFIYGDQEFTTTSTTGSQSAYNSAVNAAIADGKDASYVFCDVFDLGNTEDYSNLRIAGEQMIFVPQTGRLSGVEIGVLQSETSVTGYIHEERRFKLITDSDYGGFVPDARISVGDTYAVFGMRMPNSYIINAENELFREAVRYKYENEDLRFTFNGELDGIYAQDNWTTGDNISSKIVIGGYVNFSDPHFHPNGTLIRISSIKEFLFEPYKPQLELTNIVIGGGVKSEIEEIPKQEVIINENERLNKRLIERRWRDIQELQGQLESVFIDFSEAISPVSVSSMHYLAGNKMGQFRFVTSLTSNFTASAAPFIEYFAETNQIRISGTNNAGTVGVSESNSYIQHQTIGITSIDGKSIDGSNGTNIRPVSEYKQWIIPYYMNLPENPLEKNKFYWIYIRASKGGTSANYLVETIARTQFEDAQYYYFVVGGLNSEFDGIRGWSPLFGFTEILPGQITTGMIRSSDGNSFWNLSAGILHIGNPNSYFDWNGSRLEINNAAFNISKQDGSNAISLNPNGSGSLASGNFYWDVNGNVNMNNVNANGGTFNNVTIYGSLLSPYVAVTINGQILDARTASNYRILGGVTNISLLWNNTQDGSTITIESQNNNVISINGSNFIENGIITRRSLTIFKEVITLKYESANGSWSVIYREKHWSDNDLYGKGSKSLCRGFVFGSNSMSSSATNMPSNNYSCFDQYISGSTNPVLSKTSVLRQQRISVGRYRITLPTTWSSYFNNYGLYAPYMVFIQGLERSDIADQAVFCSVINITAQYFDVQVHNGDILVDGSFMFEVKRMAYN